MNSVVNRPDENQENLLKKKLIKVSTVFAIHDYFVKARAILGNDLLFPNLGLVLLLNLRDSGK